MGEIGTTLGRGIAGLINIFNPEIVILGGKLTVGGDYLMLLYERRSRNTPLT